MTTLDSLSPTSVPSASTQGYWDNPLDPNPREHEGPADGIDLSQPIKGLADDGPQVTVSEGMRRAAEGAVEIDGTASNPSQRTTGSTPDGKPIQIDPLHKDGQVEIARERTVAQGYVSRDQVVFTTGSGDDDVGVSQRDDGTLDVSVNGESYEVRLGEGQELTLRTGEGNDTIKVAPNVDVNIVVDAGQGDNDVLVEGNGDNRIASGDGDDLIRVTGSGRNDIHTTGGTNEIHGGSGVNVIYGGDGSDTIHAGSGTNYIEGGRGDDVIHGGGEFDIISAGRGDDTVHVGEGRTTVYAGEGQDTIEGAHAQTTVYAEVSDLVNAATGAKPTVVNVEIDNSVGDRGIAVKGSDAFVQRMQSELDFLRASPNGQQMLAEFDKAAEAKGNSVTIQELANEDNGYAQTFSNDADIINGRPGAGGDVTISYNPSFHMDAFPAPSVVLYHEMSHAYNGVNGTFLTGTYRGEGPDSGQVPNAERQAVGLETSAQPYDFDGTGPLTHNPIHLTENGIRRELGLPDRPSYAL
ncbi:M91 family zinc metallopeptidase [Luteimonas sp. S4-F44]|uniref:M91 family zinc metallopeptidase n=1 Tax=Luteimonas sp. S4-F44 TaxID=2925842 RepID=UPI001F52F570|nr:M91 family zinc metallopeptidase [Luteimonas sp. S4-F44]UNK42904.1 M91 family zinc metallopeptidase [Luteimonas sp. S4-F44]